MEQESDAELFEHVRSVIRCRSVNTQADRDTHLKHFRDPCNAGGKLHVGDRAVAYAGACFSQKLQLLIVEVDAVCIPDIISDPSESFHIGKWSDPLTLKHVVLLVLRLAQMCVEADAFFPREDRTLAQQFLGNREW